MKKIVVILLFISGTVSGQVLNKIDSINVSAIVSNQILKAFDSIPFNKPLKGKSEFHFMHPVVNNIQIKSKGPKRGQYTGKEALGNVVGNIAVLFSGIGSVSSREMNFEFNGELKCNQDKFDWQIMLYAEGELEKEKTRVENEDGSYSIEKQKTINIYWDKGLIGFIWEGEKKIGDFELFADPVINDTLRILYGNAFEAKQIPLKSVSKNKYYLRMINRPLRDYAVFGEWYEHKLVIIANGQAKSNWVYLDNNLVLIYYPSLDAMLPIKKKDRIRPYIRVNSLLAIRDHVDYYRLAMLSQYLSELLNKCFF